MYQQLEGSCNIGTKGFADFLGGTGSVLLKVGMAKAEEGGGKEGGREGGREGRVRRSSGEKNEKFRR